MPEFNDTSCAINVNNPFGEELDPDMLSAVMAKLCQYIPDASSIDVFPRLRGEADRFQPEWIEWAVAIKFRSGGALCLGAIQRKIGAPIEFHS